MGKYITVSEYCNLHKVSVQAVYARIKRGTLENIEENGIKLVLNDYVNADTSEVNTGVNEITTLLKHTIKQQEKEIKRLHKTVKQLEKERFKSVDALIDVLTRKSKPLQLEDRIFEGKGFIDAEYKPKKKSKKKRKRKK